MYNVQQTQKFSQWLMKLKDMRARIDMGPGYRIYYTMRGDELIILLVGGDKSTQQRDIEKAIAMAKEI